MFIDILSIILHLQVQINVDAAETEQTNSYNVPPQKNFCNSRH